LIVKYVALRQRFDLEHIFRFGKQNLLLTAFATPDTAYLGFKGYKKNFKRVAKQSF
jgi:hypothetical protein